MRTDAESAMGLTSGCLAVR